MRETPTQKAGDVSDSTKDEKLEDLLRAIAHAPSRVPPPEPARPGDRWGAKGRYVIETRLGRGGMGTVYSAADTLLRRTVALKVLDAGAGSDEASHRARLLREACIAAEVEHERVARVYDVGEHEGTLFVAMELVRGVTLRRWMAGRAAAAAEILAVTTQIAEGLAALHAASVYHRDLKPENVMLTDRGGVRLLDFGLARHAKRGSEGEDPALVAFTEGESLPAFSGTPGYMAPEQWSGDPLDARVDVFALGVIVHELVTGARPFERSYEASPTAEWLAPNFADAAWREMPATLAEITARMLAPDPGARFADGSEVVRALEGVQADPVSPVALLSPPAAAEIAQATTEVAPGTKPRRRRGRIVAGVVAVGMAAAGLVIPLEMMRKKLPPPALGMVWIDVGTITVGKTREEMDKECAAIGPACPLKRIAREMPATKVTIHPFQIDVYEATNEEMVATLNSIGNSLHVVEDEDAHYPRYVRWNKDLGRDQEVLADLDPNVGGIEYGSDRVFRARAGRERWPAVQVTWHAARLFCAMRGKSLPTEDEWEAAARGRENRPFPWGGEPVRCSDIVIPNDGLVPMPPECPRQVSLGPVGRSVADVTPEGVHDMGGNAAEWVDAAYVEGNRAAQTDTGADLPKVLRGGSFFDSFMARTSGRHRLIANGSAINLAFRCAAHRAP